MRASDLPRALRAIPDVELAETGEVADAIDDSVAYLASDAARASIGADTYWPKWDSPWWHMLLLWELGEASRIPDRAVVAMIDGLDALPLHTFPLRPEDVPAGLSPYRDASCHCALGSIAQVLGACGVDLDRALPWITPWFARYQMADGGLTCDADAYLVTGECPSSMVGTIAPFEAMTTHGTSSPFLDRAAGFLAGRELRLGSSTVHNAEERVAQVAWLAPCFPRFYFYDVLRGVHALVRWATTFARTLPAQAVADVVAHLVTTFPDGIVRVGRRATAGKTTMHRDAHGTWIRGDGQLASTFRLLEATSTLGAASPALTRQWAQTRRALLALLDEGRITDT